jgi:hypothetical protein
MNQTAHISLQISSISKSVETKLTGCALTSSARPARNTSDFFVLRLVTDPFVSVRAARLAPRCCVAAASVRAYLRSPADTRNPFFKKPSSFLQKSEKLHNIKGLD